MSGKGASGEACQSYLHSLILNLSFQSSENINFLLRQKKRGKVNILKTKCVGRSKVNILSFMQKKRKIKPKLEAGIK